MVQKVLNGSAGVIAVGIVIGLVVAGMAAGGATTSRGPLNSALPAFSPLWGRPI